LPGPIQDVVLRFAFDRSDLSEAAKHTLDTALVEARAGGVLAFALGGHADATGPDTYNHKLGLARAEAVRQYLVERLQVPADRVSVSSFGETQPAAPNDTRMGRAENRRVVVTVSALGSR
jgi:OOP family OmpA-OmpF porin